jgi:MFS superfamily sulfate permease-like transporter
LIGVGLAVLLRQGRIYIGVAKLAARLHFWVRKMGVFNWVLTAFFVGALPFILTSPKWTRGWPARSGTIYHRAPRCWGPIRFRA